MSSANSMLKETTHKRPHVVENAQKKGIRGDKKQQQQKNGCAVLKAREGLLSGYGSPFRVMKMFLNKTELMTAHHRECSKCHSIIRFKMVNFML